MPTSIKWNGTAGPVESLAIGAVETLTTSPTGSAYLWRIVDRPVGSSVTFPNDGSGSPGLTSTLANPTILPDVEGTYLVEVSVDGGKFVRSFGAVLLGNGTRIPAAGESREGDAAKGWMKEIDFLFRKVNDPFAVAGGQQAPGTVYFGTAAPPDVVNGTFVQSLDGASFVATSAADTYTFSPGSGTKKFWLVIPAAWAAPTLFTSNGVMFPFSSVNVPGGISISGHAYQVLCSDNFQTLGATIVVG